jgi:DNA-binding LacI/PurR family transcriptional regulator
MGERQAIMAQRTKAKAHPTIYDVARSSGVSISTVSRVVNAPQLVNEATRRKVLDAVTRLGFVPKAEASVRARKNVGNVGVLLPFFTSPSFVQRMRGVAAALAGTEYELIVYTVESAGRLHGYLDSLPLRRRLDGLILMSLPLDARHAQHILSHGLETVLIEVGFPSFCSVEIDNVEGGRIAARYLASKGYRRCAFVGESGTPAYTVHMNDLRLSGYREALEEAGIGLAEDCVNLRPYTREGVVAQTHELLSLNPPPDAIFAYSDLHAADILKAARERGLRVPDDLAVVGFDGTDMADYLGLTTVDQGLHESGRLAAELLISRISDRGRPPQAVRLQPKVIQRLSA